MSSKHDSHNHDEHEHNNDDHEHAHDDHEHGSGVWSWFNTIFHTHGHGHPTAELTGDRAFLSNEEGIRTVWWALAALTVTSVLQIFVVAFSGSVALFADTAHNIGDGLNSVPLLIAFYLARRVATRRYTYGFGKAEDVAGIFIVLSIAISAGIVFYESIRKFFEPEPLRNIGWVAAAAIIGFLGNEAVALLQIRTGRKIGSAALIADGLHARTDGLTSLAVLLAAGGTWLGFPLADPLIGILIGVAILFITRDATVTMWYRLMDAIEPELIEEAEVIVPTVEGVEELRRVRMRWMGHKLHAEVNIAVDPDLSTAESHAVAEKVRHTLFHEMTKLSEIVVHVEPALDDLEAAHAETLGHEPLPKRLEK